MSSSSNKAKAKAIVDSFIESVSPSLKSKPKQALARLAAEMQRPEDYVMARALGLLIAAREHAATGGTVIFRNADGSEKSLKEPS